MVYVSLDTKSRISYNPVIGMIPAQVRKKTEGKKNNNNNQKNKNKSMREEPGSPLPCVD